jgi:hypothetical protein
MAKKERRSALVEAALALDAALDQFQQLSRRLENAELGSEKELEKAGRMLSEVAALEAHLGSGVQALVEAIASARDRQEAQATAVASRAEAVRARAEALAALLDRFRSLGRDAGAINEAMGALGSSNGAKAEDAPAQSRATLEDVRDRLARLEADADALGGSAKEQGFLDIARQADSLRQQLVTVRGRLKLLEKRFAG